MTESSSSGKFITVEGIDGCGKTTQSEFIIDGLVDVGLSAKLVREPGGDPISEQLLRPWQKWREHYCLEIPGFEYNQPL